MSLSIWISSEPYSTCSVKFVCLFHKVTGLPPCLRGACYHTNQTPAKRRKVLEDVADGKYDILLISPEAIVGGNGNSAFLPTKLPPVAFVCIDEVHCVSEWSHNFRPSYLRLCKVILNGIQVMKVALCFGCCCIRWFQMPSNILCRVLLTQFLNWKRAGCRPNRVFWFHSNMFHRLWIGHYRCCSSDIM